MGLLVGPSEIDMGMPSYHMPTLLVIMRGRASARLRSGEEAFCFSFFLFGITD